MSEADHALSVDARREAAPAALTAFLLLVALAALSQNQGWRVLGWLAWWVWLCLAIPLLLLTIDLLVGAVGRWRKAAVALLAFLAVANVLGLAFLVSALVTTSTADLGGGELLVTGAVIWVTNVVVFGIWFWEIDAGGPRDRMTAAARNAPDFQFPQDENPRLASPGWRPAVWDYLYLSLTNSIAFSPTDAMPLTRHAKLLMGTQSIVAVATVLLVAARAVNVLGS